MSVTMPRMMLMASLLSLSSLWPSLSSALGLGEIHLTSALNEPMNAEIDLIAASPEELTALRATLAPRDAFTRYGIDRPPFLSSMTFKVAKTKDGRDVLQVRSSEAIPEPFVTFLVEVNWARGRLMREYTVLLDPPVYTPGENPSTTPPVTAPMVAGQTTPAVPSTAASRRSAASASAASAGSAGASPDTTAAPKTPRRRAGHRPAVAAPPVESSVPASTVAQTAPPAEGGESSLPGTVRVAHGDTLTKIARTLHADTPANVDQTMMALYRSNPEAFGGNINVLRTGAVLRVPNADEVASLNQKEAMGEVHRQMDAWRSGGGTAASAAPSGHLRLVTPTGAGSGTATGSKEPASTAQNADNQALRDRVKDLEGQLAESKRLIDIRNGELSDLQRKLAAPGPTPSAPLTPQQKIAATPPPPVPTPVPPVATAPPVTTAPPPVAPAVEPPAASAPVSQTAPPPAETSPVPVPVPPPVVTAPAKKPVAAAPPAESGSWVDWIADHWWIPLAALIAILAILGIVAVRKRRQSASSALDDVDPILEETHVSDSHDPGKLTTRRHNDSIVVEESGEHPMPEFDAAEATGRFSDTGELKSADDTLSSESAVNLDQGDPLAEADFHMAYGLYDQAADLVRIALEREPERRDLRLKLLEIYFVWGNKDAFLQTAKGLEATRDRAPAGEWDKIVIMGKQICPDEPMFASIPGSGRGAGALVDLNLEGGENRVDIDLFGEPEGERSNLDHAAKEHDDTAVTGESPHLHAAAGSSLDFTLDAPERGADDSPTREMPPRDEPTVEAEMMNFADAPTTESPALKTAEFKTTDMRDRISSKLASKPEQTAEVSIDDLGLDLDQLEQTGHPAGASIPRLEETDHPADAPTMVAGLDERSRRMMEDAAKNAQDRDLTELERELEASFVADLDSHQDEIKTAVLGPESAPTVLMPRDRQADPAATGRFRSASPEFSDIRDPENADIDSTSKLRGLTADSIDLDLDRLATALSSGDTREQPRAAEEVFSTEVFEASQRNRRVDLDVGDALNGSEHATNKLQISTNKMKPVDLPLPEMEPVTMSEVGTKLDLARAYMDMGDPEGARSILEEVVQEGSASQKQEASRLIESLPG